LQCRAFANLDALLTQSDNEIQFPAVRQIRHFHYGNVNGKHGAKAPTGQRKARPDERSDSFAIGREADMGRPPEIGHS
jgi:hypothetical protein